MRQTVFEAMSLTDVINIISPDKLARIEGGEEAIEALMPELTIEEQRYLEYLAAGRYKQVIQKLERLTGQQFQTRQQITPVLTSAYQLVGSFVNRERQHKEQLEALALQIVLDLPQFALLKKAYENDEIRFDLHLGPVTIDLLEPPPEIEENEEAEIEVAKTIQDLDEEKLKRKLANMIIQGASVSYFDVFRMAQQELEAIVGQGVSNQYALFMSIVDVLYWHMPEGIEIQAARAPLGAEKIKEEDDGVLVIKAQGVCFPVLVHEIIKGSMEALTSKAEVSSQQVLNTDTLESETFDIMLGPALWSKLQSLVSVDDQKHLIWVFQKLLQLPTSTDAKSRNVMGFKQAIQTILSSNNQAKSLINTLINDINQELKQYEEQKEEFEKQEWKDIESQNYPEDDDEDDDGLAYK